MCMHARAPTSGAYTCCRAAARNFTPHAEEPWRVTAGAAMARLTRCRRCAGHARVLRLGLALAALACIVTITHWALARCQDHGAGGAALADGRRPVGHGRQADVRRDVGGGAPLAIAVLCMPSGHRDAVLVLVRLALGGDPGGDPVQPRARLKMADRTKALRPQSMCHSRELCHCGAWPTRGTLIA